MNARERLHDNRPYWKVVVSLSFSLLGTAVFLVVGIKGLLYFMPFVIGWFLSFLVSPIVMWLENHFKIVKKLSSALIIVVVLGACVALIYFACSKIWNEIESLVQNFPEMYAQLEAGFREIGSKGSQIFTMLPSGIKDGFLAIAANLDEMMGDLIGRLSEPTVEVAGNIAKRIPSILINVIMTIIAAYFFIAERENVLRWAKKITPKPIVERMSMVMDNLKYAVGGYFKAQFKIMGVVFLILLIGFTILGMHFSILLALGIALLDFFPFFGTGTALGPWAVYKFLVGDYKMMIGLIVIYAVTQIVRQLIQPKLVGDSIGMNPLCTLVFLYVGYKVAGVLGMVFAVPVGMIVINLYKAGAFDYILDDVAILAEGVLQLREKGDADK